MYNFPWHHSRNYNLGLLFSQPDHLWHHSPLHNNLSRGVKVILYKTRQLVMWHQLKLLYCSTTTTILHQIWSYSRDWGGTPLAVCHSDQPGISTPWIPLPPSTLTSLQPHPLFTPFLQWACLKRRQLHWKRINTHRTLTSFSLPKEVML